MALVLCALLFAASTTSLGPSPSVPPIAGLTAKDLLDTFDQMRGTARHEAIDIIEPRGTPVHAVVDGTIAKSQPIERVSNLQADFDLDSVISVGRIHVNYRVGVTLRVPGNRSL